MDCNTTIFLLVLVLLLFSVHIFFLEIHAGLRVQSLRRNLKLFKERTVS